MKKLLVATFSLAVASSAGFAADLPSKKNAPVAAAACSSSWAVSAREWYAQHRFGKTGDNTLWVPLTGLSVSYTPSTCDGITYTLTSLYGEASKNYSTAKWTSLEDFKTKWARFDTELSVQIPVASYFAWNVNARYIHAPTKDSGHWHGSAATAARTETYDLYLASGGGVFKFPFSAQTNFFAGANLGIGYQAASAGGWVNWQPYSTVSGGIYSADAYAGVQQTLSAKSSLTARYRVGGFSNTGFRGPVYNTLIHGPELNLTYRF